jgi:carboxymethylenebutenolidase
MSPFQRYLAEEIAVDHAFFNDTGARYNATAAARAYRRVLDWFGRYLA